MLKKDYSNTRRQYSHNGDTSCIQPLDTFDIEYDRDSGIQGCQFNYQQKIATRFLLVRGGFEALTLCLYGYVLDDFLPRINSFSVYNRRDESETGAETESKGDLDEEMYLEPIYSCHNSKFRVSKLNEVRDLHKEIQSLTDSLRDDDLIDPLLNGTLNRLLNDYSYISQSQTQSQPTSQGLFKSTPQSMIGLHCQKAWVELKQQICEVEEIAKKRVDLSVNSSEQLRSLQQLLHRINQLLVDALTFVRSNRVPYEDDLKKLMRVMCKSMSITLGLFSLAVFRSCLSLVCTLCSCGDDISKLVLDYDLVHALFFPLHSANSSTNLKIQILEAATV
ncbi:hypothetical protein K7432_012299, partial [Basidiobolus ranarum]